MTVDEGNLLEIKRRICESKLDGNVKITAVAALDRYFESHYRRCCGDDVDSFFIWDEQPEGRDFWRRIHDVIGYGDS